MRFARDSIKGDIITAGEYLGRYAGLKKKDQPVAVCPHENCKAPVYVSDRKMTLGFVATGRELTDRQRKIDGFSHTPHKANPECPEYYVQDPRFEDLTRHTNTAEIIARNKKVLLEPKIRQQNRMVLDKLFTAATGRDPTITDEKNLVPAAKMALTTEALADNAFLYPYMIMAFSGIHQPHKKRYKVGFVGAGRQELKYVDTQGTSRVLIAPRELQLSFVNPSNQRPVHNYEVSKEAWAQIAGVKLEPVAPPPTTSVTLTIENVAVRSNIHVQISPSAAPIAVAGSKAAANKAAAAKAPEPVVTFELTPPPVAKVRAPSRPRKTTHKADTLTASLF